MLENRLEEYSSHAASVMYVHCESNTHPKADISHFIMIDKGSKKVVRGIRKTIHMRITNPALNHNISVELRELVGY